MEKKKDQFLKVMLHVVIRMNIVEMKDKLFDRVKLATFHISSQIMCLKHF